MRTRGRGLAAMALGAALMYLFDPTQGSRRRANVRNTLAHLGRRGSRSAAMIARDLFNRAHGAVAETQARLMEVEVSDDVLEERVRAKLGHVLAHVSALEISAKGGQVVLAGEALVDEIEPLLSRTRGVRGVKSVESHVTARAWGADGHAVPAPA